MRRSTNELYHYGEPAGQGAEWHRHGLHRPSQTVVSVVAGSDSLTVFTHEGPCRWNHLYELTWVWTATVAGVHLDLRAAPQGTWPSPIHRLGITMSLPTSATGMSWVGSGPGEAYVDSHEAVRIGFWSATLAELRCTARARYGCVRAVAAGEERAVGAAVPHGGQVLATATGLIRGLLDLGIVGGAG